VTVVSPCECRDNHRRGRQAVKTDASTLPTDASTISSRHAYCKEIASTRGVRCELSTAARFWLAQRGQEQTSLLSPRLNYGGRNHEKNAIDHCLGSSGVVCVGTDPTAAAYEDARRAETEAANHNHDHRRYRRHGTITQYSPGSAIVLKETSDLCAIASAKRSLM